RCFAVARRAWRESPIRGLVRCGSADSVHTYLSADLGTWALLAGLRREADTVLTALLHWRTASGGSPELFTAADRTYGDNLPPHASSAAALLTLIRNTLVFDDDDTLRLTLGARSKWWVRGSVRGAPTRWGLIDVSFHEARDTATWS